MSQCRQPRVTRRICRAAVVAVVAATIVVIPAQALAGPSLELRAPQRVTAGHAVSVTLVVRGARNVAGWEARVRFDSASAEFAGMSGLGHGTGRSAGQLGPVDTADGVAIGGYASRARTRSTLTLARVRLIPRGSGTLAVAVAGLRLVDGAGHRIVVRNASHQVAIRIGKGGSFHAAPREARLVPARPAPISPKVGDLDGDGLVLMGDLADESRAWDATRETGRCAATGDVDGNGCVDVSDVERVARSVRARPFTLIPAAPGLFTVNSTGDEPDATPGDGVCLTVSRRPARCARR